MNLKSLKNRLQFVITLNLFFPVILDAMYKDSKNQGSGQIIIYWGFVVAILLLNYLLIEWLDQGIKGWVVRWADLFLIGNIVSFILLFTILAMVQKQNLPSWYILPFSVGVMGTMVSPVIIFIFLIINGFNVCIDSFKKQK